MWNRFNRILCLVIIILSGCVYCFYTRSERIKKERDNYKGNTHSLLSDIKRIRVDSMTMAADVKVLKLTLDEYKEYRADDLETIKKMKVQIKSLQVAANHKLEVNAPIDTQLKDTVLLRDTVFEQVKMVDVNTLYLRIKGIIDNNQLTGRISLPVTLQQSVWIEYKHRFLWWKWGTKAIHQTIYSDNPHVEIKYSEYIQIIK